MERARQRSVAAVAQVMGPVRVEEGLATGDGVGVSRRVRGVEAGVVRATVGVVGALRVRK